jgi:hypothetical protein
MVNVQNVGQKVNLKYYQVTPEMRNLGVICVITNLQWMSSNKWFTDIGDLMFSYASPK